VVAVWSSMTRPIEIDLLVEAFRRNAEVNRAVLESLSFDDLGVADGRGGWSIGQCLGHAIEFRYGWLSIVAPAHAEAIPSVADSGEDGAPRLTASSIGELVAALAVADAAVLAAVDERLDAGTAFEGAYESHPAQFIVHTLVHDAHHRGQLMSLLRARARRTREQMDELDAATWPIWRR
jgi:uncharacterized damage-inducible protein DinB